MTPQAKRSKDVPSTPEIIRPSDEDMMSTKQVGSVAGESSRLRVELLASELERVAPGLLPHLFTITKFGSEPH